MLLPLLVCSEVEFCPNFVESFGAHTFFDRFSVCGGLDGLDRYVCCWGKVHFGERFAFSCFHQLDGFVWVGVDADGDVVSEPFYVFAHRHHLRVKWGPSPLALVMPSKDSFAVKVYVPRFSRAAMVVSACGISGGSQLCVPHDCNVAAVATLRAARREFLGFIVLAAGPTATWCLFLLSIHGSPLRLRTSVPAPSSSPSPPGEVYYSVSAAPCVVDGVVALCGANGSSGSHRTVGKECVVDVVEFVQVACDIQGAFEPEDRSRMMAVYEASKGLSPVEFLDRVVEFGNMLDDTIVSLRKGPAVFSTGREASKPDQIARQLGLLSGFVAEATPAVALEAYWRFEEIHPLADGNGRLGMVLFNMLNNTLHDPTIPVDNPVWG